MPQAAVNAFVHVLGPQELFVRFRGQGSWQYVGTCVQAPEPELTTNFLEVFNDYGGRVTPFNRVYDGQIGLVPIVINRMDLAVCRNMRDVSTTTSASHGATTNIGVDNMLERGSLVFGSTDFEFAIKNTFFGTINATTGMVAGRKYHSALVGAYKESSVGQRVQEVAMVIICNNLFYGPTVGFKMYTEDATEGEFSSMTSN